MNHREAPRLLSFTENGFNAFAADRFGNGLVVRSAITELMNHFLQRALVEAIAFQILSTGQ